jgi:hypothetical protein
MSACIQPAPLTPTRSAGFAIEAGSLATSARPTPNATAERRACVAGARPRRVHLALRVGALGRSLDRGDPCAGARTRRRSGDRVGGGPPVLGGSPAHPLAAAPHASAPRVPGRRSRSTAAPTVRPGARAAASRQHRSGPLSRRRASPDSEHGTPYADTRDPRSSELGETRAASRKSASLCESRRPLLHVLNDWVSAASGRRRPARSPSSRRSRFLCVAARAAVAAPGAWSAARRSARGR